MTKFKSANPRSNAMTTRKTIRLEIPIIIVRESPKFIYSCDTLSVYAQSDNLKNAKDGFIKSVEHLFEVLSKDGNLIEFLTRRNVLKEKVKKLEFLEGSITIPDFEVGEYTKWELPANIMAGAAA